MRKVLVGSLKTGEKLWDRSFGAKANPKWVRVLAANKDVVVWGQGNGAVVCVKTATGERLWETSVAEAPHNDGVKRTPGVLLDKIHIMDDRVVFISLYEKRAVAIKSGKTLWRKVGGSNFSESVLVGDQIFLTGNDWIDTKTGDFYRGAPLESPRKLLGKRGVTAHFASGSHIFGSTNGNTLLMAWDRRTGALEWTHEPEGAFGTSHHKPLTSAYGRLYFVDFNGRTFCYEPGVSQETGEGLTVIQAARAPTTKPSRTLPATRKKSASVARKRVPKPMAR